jgi:hypothetical protein
VYKILTVVSYLWIGFIALLNFIGAFFMFYNHGFSSGLQYIQETYSPYNIANYIAEVISLSPALGIIWLRNKLRTKGKI